MSTTPTTISGNTTLDSINKALQIGLAIGQLVEPGIVGIVTGIRALINAKGEVAYEVVQQMNSDMIAKMTTVDQADLAVLDAELARLAGATPAPSAPVTS